ncbi:MAG TPA: hypothetical protein VN520_18045 [Streptomyces sp.]|uniref:hypothetical protein n=1 Tax=Streptomyces sp. TaxID=1931 RepID=UPI002BB69987|nr:hypothetical protein [Streptomyces sp.]HWU08255.1 hypothetical protein [Streptomyces sp.]
MTTSSAATTATTAVSAGSGSSARRFSVGSALTAGGVAAVAAGVVNLAVSLTARGPLGVSAEFLPLTPGPIVMWTVLGVLVGAFGWRLIVNRSQRSGAVLRTLVPTVLGVSLLPDVALLVSDAMPGTSTTGVLALMVMHVLTAGIAVAAYRRWMPTA